jgi:hypothetical protein
MRLAAVGFLALSTLMTSCCGVRFVALNAPPRGAVPRAPESVEVFAAGPPARPHVDVGMIYLLASSADSYVREVRAEGARRGCDAVVISLRYSTCLAYE